jgi:hypothetical protein
MLHSEYYEERLYPLQNGVANVVCNCATPFYLTGGTALSRVYYRHRYSDDLDFFVNNCDEFQHWVKKVLVGLETAGYSWDPEKGFVQSPNFVSLILLDVSKNTRLKIDFVNDTVAHYGDFAESDLFARVDSVRNILSNKLGAVFRYSAKDIADIREIALHQSFDWTDMLIESRSKDRGIEAVAIAEVLIGVPQTAFESILWQNPTPTWPVFIADVKQIAQDLLTGGANSLST